MTKDIKGSFSYHTNGAALYMLEGALAQKLLRMQLVLGSILEKFVGNPRSLRLLRTDSTEQGGLELTY